MRENLKIHHYFVLYYKFHYCHLRVAKLLDLLSHILQSFKKYLFQSFLIDKPIGWVVLVLISNRSLVKCLETF